MKMSPYIVFASSILLLSACTSRTVQLNEACVTNLAAVAASPAAHIGKQFCGEAILVADRLLAFARPIERPDLRSDELAIIVMDGGHYENAGIVAGKKYRVRIEGLIDSDVRCSFRRTTCAPPTSGSCSSGHRSSRSWARPRVSFPPNLGATD